MVHAKCFKFQSNLKRLSVLQFMELFKEASHFCQKNLKTIIVNIIYQRLASDVIFLDLNKHDLEHEVLTEDLHSNQLIKKLLINMLLSD